MRIRWRIASLLLAALTSGCHLFGAVDVPVGSSDLAPFVIPPRDMNVGTIDQGPPSCGLNSCQLMNASCGPIGDGCGGVLQCGSCPLPETCGGSGVPFQCGGMAGCIPLTCAQLGLHCGPAGDGCGGTVSCGGCPTGQTCGGGGVNGTCGAGGSSGVDGGAGACVPRTCGSDDCGTIGDGCGKLVICGAMNGMCPVGQTCGGGGVPFHCGKPACVPMTCAQQGFNCGMVGDGCGNLIDCSNGVPCPGAQTCGGGGSPNVCGSPACVPKTCLQQGFNCGVAGDGCGNLIANGCGTCNIAGQTCGGNGKPNVCGAPGCTPKTCAQLGFNCGAAGDGCGNLIANGCGTCTMPDICGAVKPNVCGNNIVGGGGGNCDGGSGTTITGTVVAPTDPTAGFGNPDPIYNATVYVPKNPLTALTAGATCDKCSNGVSAIVSTTTNLDGTFTLQNPPTGVGVTVVIQLGKWRRVLTLNVRPCTANALTTDQTRFPRKQGEFNQFDNIPRLALATGDVDTLQCVLRKMGIADTEFMNPALNGGGTPTATGRVHIYTASYNANNGSPGAVIDNNTPGDDSLWGSQTTLDAYDAVLFPCTGGEDARPASALANLQAYANLGGRIFATHYSYVYLKTNQPWGCGAGCVTPAKTTAAWRGDTQYNPQFTGFIDQSFPKGVALASWLQQPAVMASTTAGQIPVNVVRRDFNSVINGQQWMYSTHPPNPGPLQFPIHYTFNTPTTSTPANQCGRVVFSDFHVENASGTDGTIFPNECNGNSPMTPQEKLLEFMLFDLTSCVSPDVPTCTKQSCGQLGFQCGMQGDGCGGSQDCGSCPTGQVCGGGGQPGICSGGCTPQTCATLGYSCGTWGDGCGGTAQPNPCGTCPSGKTCGGGGVPGQCGGGCTPLTCAQLGAACGVQGNGCGGVALPNPCGTCSPPQTCGGGGVPNQCGGGCKPLTCAQLGLNCGPAGDGCGGMIPNGCGTCPMGQSCGGGGVPGQCGTTPDGGVMCKPITCLQQGLSCGAAGDGCGNLLQCGPCTPPQTCGGGGTPGQCGAPNCTPITCMQVGANCGIIGDGCGGTVDCGVCTSPDTCGGGGNANVCGRIL